MRGNRRRASAERPGAPQGWRAAASVEPGRDAVLSGRTRGLVGAAELALMKPTARLVNTSRGPIVVEADLLEALRKGKIAGDGQPAAPAHD